MLRWLTAGESHGCALVGILDGMPAGLEISEDYIDRQLARRQLGYGRGGRMRIERDRVRILSGVRFGRTLGSPIALLVENRDWENWKDVMSVGPGETRPVTVPRPGHADLAGFWKFGHRDLRNVLERASARETAMRVALGAVARRLLEEFGMEIGSFVLSVGQASWEPPDGFFPGKEVDTSPLRCPDPEATRRMQDEVDCAREAGDSVGGMFEVVVRGVPPGLGSYVQVDRRLDARLAAAVMGIPAVKGVEIG
ncbi:MAG: chorismate synthase, partial [Candidatus Latescibacterota bacterium]